MIMKNVALLGLLVAFFSISVAPTPPVEKINWMTWEEAVVAMEKEPRKLFVDVYTDWCGWCKVMDQKTFSKASVVEYMNQNYYAVKLDAEQKEDIQFAGKTFKYVPSGRRGYHELAANLLQGNMSYPTVVYLNENIQLLSISPGFKEEPQLMKELTFFGDNHYKTTSWKEYSAK